MQSNEMKPKDLQTSVKNIDYKGAISDIEALCLSLTLASCSDEVLEWDDTTAYMAYVANSITENIRFIRSELGL